SISAPASASISISDDSTDVNSSEFSQPANAMVETSKDSGDAMSEVRRMAFSSNNRRPDIMGNSAPQSAWNIMRYQRISILSIERARCGSVDGSQLRERAAGWAVPMNVRCERFIDAIDFAYDEDRERDTDRS